MRTYYLTIVLSLILALAGCATTSTQSMTDSSSSNVKEVPTWGNRVQALSNISDWDLNALVAIRANTTRDAGSANMNWKQTKQDYDILLFGPLGSHAVKLAGKPGQVSLETADGKKINAATPEALLLQQSGWHLPVSNLYYWIRGLPVPKIPSQKTLDGDNRLALLAQQGWKIQYLHYQTVDHVDVPDKLLLTNAQVDVKIIIKKWQF